MMFDDRILLSRNRLEVMSGNLVLLSQSKKVTKLDIKIIKKNKDVVGILIDSKRLLLVSKVFVLRNVRNKRKEAILTPSNSAPLKSNFLYESSFLILEISNASFSDGIDRIIMIIRQIAIGIIEKNVSRQP